MLTIFMWIIRILMQILYIYSILIVIYTLLTWIPRTLQTKLGQILARIVEPYLNLFQRFIPPIAGISFAPIIALLVIYFVNNYVLVWIANIVLHFFG
ncbi:YggT family protein [Lactobacillus rodentium]|uniref:Cell division membrane protein n=2 Tax=Lactobacillus rodentium TaxID=947835 RepID=A0A2Z6T6G6_9LACO|nr:YggT family protein [Lactobacillus rodentium]GBG04674.1 cell division membrane protein [Lactobacillus rodentium]